MLIYKVYWLAAERDFSVLEPPARDVRMGFPEFYMREIERFVTDFFWGKVDIFHITREFAKLYLMREFLKLKYVKGMTSAVAYVGAKVNFKAFMSARAASVAWLAIGLAAAPALVAICYAIAKWTEDKQGTFTYPEGVCILRYGNKLWWGGAVGRPRERTWDVGTCFEEGLMFFWERRTEGPGYGRTDFWDFVGLWEWTWATLLGWHTYRAGQMRVMFLGKGVDRGLGIYRIRVPDWADPPFDKPVGWGIRLYHACEYLVEPWDLYTAR